MAPLRPEPTPAANALPPRPPPPPPPPPESDPADADISEEINILDAGDVEEIVLAGDDGSADDVEEINLEFDAPGDAWEQVFIDDEPAPEAVLADAPNTRQPRAAPPGARAVGPDEDTISSTDEFEALSLDADDLEFPLEPVAEAAPAPVRAPPPAPMAPAPKPAPAVATPERVPPPKAPAPAVPAVAPRPAPAPAPAPAPLAAPAPVVPRELAPPPPAAQMDTGAYIKKALGELNSPPGTLARIKQRAALIRMAQTAGALLLALLLVAQFVNYSRDALAEAPLIGKALVALYARAGIVVEPRWDLTAYDVRQWGAGSDAEPGTLRLRASVINRARRGQPYPLLRVTLEDRFGGKIARREFAAQEYLPGRAAPEGLLAPGARADADLKLADPGREAVGFELDICLPHQGALICGADQKAAAGG